MWNELWYSLGRAAGFAARSIGGTPGHTAKTPSRHQYAKGERCSWRSRLPWRLGVPIQASRVMTLLGLTAAGLSGAASAAFRRIRAIVIATGTQVSLVALAQMLSGRRSQSPSIEAVREQAEGIAQVLRERDIIPDKLGIDGIPGSGKSTLARALAERLDMEWKSLDYRNLGLPGRLSSERTVYEHHRLFRTQDVDAFDVIVYIDEPVERSKAKVLRRRRGLLLAAVLDYSKLKKVGELAFDVCEGEPVAVRNSDLVLKIKPPEGFRAVENIASRLKPSGCDTSGMSKEEMLFLLAYGKRAGGLAAYLLPLDYIARMGRLAAALHSAGRRFVTVLCANDSASRHGGARPSARG